MCLSNPCLNTFFFVLSTTTITITITKLQPFYNVHSLLSYSVLGTATLNITPKNNIYKKDII